MLSFEGAWHELDPRFRAALTQAWESLRRKGLPVGAVISYGDDVIASGRNRVYDARGGDDPLQRTPIAHAEMNALASVPEDVDLDECELWTTQKPCSMCQAAIEFTGLGAVHYLATDPSSVDGPYASQSDDVWMVVANVLFLHNVAWVSGTDHAMLDRNRGHEPEVAALARDLVAQQTLVALAEQGATIEEALVEAWESITAASTQRQARFK